MLLIRAGAGKSKRHGLGLFARQLIPSGTKVWEFRSGFDQVLTPAAVADLPPPAQEYVRTYGWPDPRTGSWIFPGDDDRYTNHANNPNTAFGPGGTYALRDIANGEEITMDYREPGWAEFSVEERVRRSEEGGAV